jgi:CBS domain-containing protein
VEIAMGKLVRDVMQTDVVCAGPGETLGEVRKRSDLEGVGAMPVVNEYEEVVGFFSYEELLMDGRDDQHIRAMMSSPAYTVEPDASASEAARLMCEHGIHHLAVTDAGKLVGVVSSFDLLRLLADE